MRIPRVIPTAAAVLAATGSVILTPAAPAGAAPAKPSRHCPQGYVCYWTEPNFRGEMTVLHDPYRHFCGATTPQPARTIYNNDNEAWAFYRDLDCSTLAVTLPPGHFDSDTEAYSWK